MSEDEKTQEEESQESGDVDAVAEAGAEADADAGVGAQEEADADMGAPGVPIAPSFAILVGSLATQALIGLGEIDHPGTGKNTPDLEQAKFTIDLLGVLEEKTRGNLSEDESFQLTSALQDLRMRYVKASSATA